MHSRIRGRSSRSCSWGRPVDLAELSGRVLALLHPEEDQAQVEEHLGVVLGLRLRCEREHASRATSPGGLCRTRARPPPPARRCRRDQVGGPAGVAQGRQAIGALQPRREREPRARARRAGRDRRLQRAQRARARARREVRRVAGRLVAEVQQVVGVRAVEAVRVEPLHALSVSSATWGCPAQSWAIPSAKTTAGFLLRQPLAAQPGCVRGGRGCRRPSPARRPAAHRLRAGALCAAAYDGRVAALDGGPGQVEEERRAAGQGLAVRVAAAPPPPPPLAATRRPPRSSPAATAPPRHEDQPPAPVGNTHPGCSR